MATREPLRMSCWREKAGGVCGGDGGGGDEVVASAIKKDATAATALNDWLIWQWLRGREPVQEEEWGLNGSVGRP